MRYPYRPTPEVGKSYLVMDIPRDGDWMQSFDTVIPRKIQGRTCIIVEPARSADYFQGSKDNLVKIDESLHLVPTWALEKVGEKEELNYEI